MPQSLVIVESPTKARTIKRYLGRGYRVEASRGHVKDLPKKQLGVDVDNGFAPTYVIIPGKEPVIKKLRTAASKAAAVYLAADPDREGEAICAHLAEVITQDSTEAKRAKKKAQRKPSILRVTMNEITRRAIRQAFVQPGTINQNLVDAQQARRILDRLVGYEVSPLLWDKVKRGLSAGRVQTVALRLVVERERAIRAFVPQEYWTLTANLAAAVPPPFAAKLIELKGTKLEIRNEEEARQHTSALESQTFIVHNVTQKERHRHPVPPFITSTLQQEAARKLGFSVKRTMSIAQRLYEGIALGREGRVGLITYMRTDSTRVANEALAEVRALVLQRYGQDYLPEKPHYYRSRKTAQQAHEAIRPTAVFRTPEGVKRYLREDEFKLYQLIWQRFLASQMRDALLDLTTIDVAAGDYLLRATSSVVKFPGFLAVYEEGKDEPKEVEEEVMRALPEVRVGERLQLQALKPEQHFTQPAARYTEATLVKELEAKGIGRPSTYATILSTILERDYVRKQQGRFLPTPLGELVADLLVKSFADIFDVAYTARMEAQLDAIEAGKLAWRHALEGFYEKFAKDLERAGAEMENVKAGLATEETCERCGQPMLLRMGRHGLFLACSGYPDCTNTREPQLEVHGIDSDDTTPEAEIYYCENCGREMVLKRGRYGQFLACSGYPDCKTTRPLDRRGRLSEPTPLAENCPECGGQLVLRRGRYGEFVACANFPQCRYKRQKTLGIRCPQCSQGELVERRARRGRRLFYGCARYPECNFTCNDKPLPESCPQCGATFLLERYSRKGSLRYCQQAGCEYKVAVS